ncbi:MAG: ShlB/FhaC/HecB family hemolysin secretion/activation protein [Microcoleaceae cyanobacterium]
MANWKFYLPWHLALQKLTGTFNLTSLGIIAPALLVVPGQSISLPLVKDILVKDRVENSLVKANLLSDLLLESQPEQSVQLAPQPPSLSPLPEIEPSLPPPPPEPLIQPQSSPQPQQIPGTIPQTTVVQKFEVIGSTVFSPDDFAAITQPFTNRPISLLDLYQVRSAITQLYVEQGYINSGAFIPPQELTQGLVRIQVIEGGLEAINVSGTRRLRPSYIRSRLALATTQPLNVSRLLEALQLLQLDPLIETISSELSASPRQGLSILDITVVEADSFEFRLFADNQRTPSVGSFRRGVGFTEANLLGFGDSLSFDYGNTDGSNSFDLNYTVPFNARNGTLSASVGLGPSEVISRPFNELDITSDSRYYELTLRQPMIQRPTQEFTVGLTGSHQSSETELLDTPFPIAAGADDQGRTKVSAIRFFQEWVNRDSQSVLALRSQFSLGIGAFDATINDGDIPDSRFFTWRLQGQWVRLLAEDTLFLLRGDLQLASEPLLALEQFRLGGLDSVRGYPRDTLLIDNGVFVSAEVRLPIARIPEWDAILHLTPFVEYGQGWNDSGLDPEPDELGSVGLGIQWQQGDSLSIRAGIGIPWNSIDSPDRSWLEDRIYFSVIFTPF